MFDIQFFEALNIAESFNENSFFPSFPSYYLKDDKNNYKELIFPLDKQIDLHPIICPEDFSFKTDANSSNFLKNIETILENSKEQKIKFEEEGNLSPAPTQFTFDKVKTIIQKINLPENVKSMIFSDANIIKIEKEMKDVNLTNKKRRRKKGIANLDDDLENIKVGRKKQTDSSKSKHNRNSADNIIKKAKSYFINYSLKFINNVLNTELSLDELIEYNKIFRIGKVDVKEEDIKTSNLIKLLDYKFIDQIKKEKDLALLRSPLKDIFSNDISPKYSTFPKDWNKQIIQKIIEDRPNNPSIMFAFNLTFREWIDIFTFKKSLSFFNNYDEEKMALLNNNFIKIDKLILEIYDKNDVYINNYLSYFLYYAYNYERWFYNKKGRRRVSNKETQQKI